MRCVYCVSPDDRTYMPREHLLEFEEIATIVRALTPQGLRRIRLTGGEPLVRPHLPDLVHMLAQIPGVEDLSLSTNGLLLPRYVDSLKRNGLKRVNISLDTLQPRKFHQISPVGRWEAVWAGIEAALAAGLHPVKINCVLMRGINDDEILDFAQLTLHYPLHVRFIELMPIGNYAFYHQGHQLPIREAKARCAQLGELVPVQEGEAIGGGPAQVFRLPDARGTLGFIGACTENFCSRCNRVRLSADGYLYPCLGHGVRVDLKPALQQPPAQREAAILAAVVRALERKPAGHQFLMHQPHPIFRTLRAIGG
jgi:cyclic pyranopterin phosphate synthase